VLGGLLLSLAPIRLRVGLPEPVRGAVSATAYLWAFASTGAWVIFRVWRNFSRRLDHEAMDPSRRAILNAAGTAAVLAPFAITAFGSLVERTNFGVREVDLPFKDLPPDLDGLRIAQISDIHLSLFLSENEFARVIDAANELRPNLILITGDLISFRGDPLDACIRQLARLRADGGLYGCLGNHEVYAKTEEYTVAECARRGIRFLRAESLPLKFGNATLQLSGVDYESIWKRPHYLSGAERLKAPGAFNVLMSHNPDVFPAAAAKGFDLTVSGHTHGGQVTVEYLQQTLNLARFVTPYVYGTYRRGEKNSALYVTRGIGTIGLPLRLGAQPEIAVLRLSRI
jgi:predicted MPP superfamily phosphohydrolase